MVNEHALRIIVLADEFSKIVIFVGNDADCSFIVDRKNNDLLLLGDSSLAKNDDIHWLVILNVVADLEDGVYGGELEASYTKAGGP